MARQHTKFVANDDEPQTSKKSPRNPRSLERPRYVGGTSAWRRTPPIRSSIRNFRSGSRAVGLRAKSHRLSGAESAPTATASRRTGVRAIAVIPLRARNNLHRPPETFFASATDARPRAYVLCALAGANETRAPRRPATPESTRRSSARPPRMAGAAAKIRQTGPSFSISPPNRRRPARHIMRRSTDKRIPISSPATAKSTSPYVAAEMIVLRGPGSPPLRKHVRGPGTKIPQVSLRPRDQARSSDLP